MSIKKLTHFMVLVMVAGQLAACQTIEGDAPQTSLSKQERLDNAIERVAVSASLRGSANAKLVALEKRYKRNSSKPAYALRYARELRKTNHLNLAATILEPFADAQDSYRGVKTEMSMIALGLGNYDSAENYAKQAVIQDPIDYEAYQNLGIALDAKEMHPEAERAFRKGLENWKGDPTTIMNNLALNLATQGFIDEAIEVLERAKALSPDRIEIERNLRIIRTLNER